MKISHLLLTAAFGLSASLLSAFDGPLPVAAWSFDYTDGWQLGGAAIAGTSVDVDVTEKTEGQGSLRVVVNFPYDPDRMFVDLYTDSLKPFSLEDAVLSFDFRTSNSDAHLLVRLVDASGTVKEALVSGVKKDAWKEVTLSAAQFGGAENFGLIGVIQLRFVGDDLPSLPATVTFGIDDFKVISLN